MLTFRFRGRWCCPNRRAWGHPQPGACLAPPSWPRAPARRPHELVTHTRQVMQAACALRQSWRDVLMQAVNNVLRARRCWLLQQHRQPAYNEAEPARDGDERLGGRAHPGPRNVALHLLGGTAVPPGPGSSGPGGLVVGRQPVALRRVRLRERASVATSSAPLRCRAQQARSAGANTPARPSWLTACSARLNTWIVTWRDTNAAPSG